MPHCGIPRIPFNRHFALKNGCPDCRASEKNRVSLNFQSKFGANGCVEERSAKSKNTLCMKAFCDKVLRQNDRCRIRVEFSAVPCIQIKYFGGW